MATKISPADNPSSDPDATYPSLSETRVDEEDVEALPAMLGEWTRTQYDHGKWVRYWTLSSRARSLRPSTRESAGIIWNGNCRFMNDTYVVRGASFVLAVEIETFADAVRVLKAYLRAREAGEPPRAAATHALQFREQASIGERPDPRDTP